MYLFGHYGHEVDFEIAKSYFEQVDFHQEPKAAAVLGRIYEFGLGVEQNGPKAIEYYESAISKVGFLFSSFFFGFNVKILF